MHLILNKDTILKYRFAIKVNFQHKITDNMYIYFIKKIVYKL